MKINSIAKRNNQILPEIREERVLEEGNNEISFSMDTSHLGINEFTIQTFYKFNVNNKEILLPSDKIVFNMGVVNELSDLNPEIIVITEVITVTEEKIVFVEKEGLPPLAIGAIIAGLAYLAFLLFS